MQVSKKSYNPSLSVGLGVRFSKFILFLLVFSMAFVACKKDDDKTPDQTQLAGGSMSAKVEGQEFKATLSVQATVSGTVFSFAGTANASASSVRQINIAITDYKGVGTYGFTNPGNVATWTEGLTADKMFIANFILGSGQVVVTEVANGRAKGTFEFTGSNGEQTKTITEGKFDVKI